MNFEKLENVEEVEEVQKVSFLKNIWEGKVYFQSFKQDWKFKSIYSARQFWKLRIGQKLKSWTNGTNGKG